MEHVTVLLTADEEDEGFVRELKRDREFWHAEEDVHTATRQRCCRPITTPTCTCRTLPPVRAPAAISKGQVCDASTAYACLRPRIVQASTTGCPYTSRI